MEKKSAFGTFSSDDLFRGNRWKGQEMPLESISALKEEAGNLKHSRLWKLLKAELEWFALKSLIENGKDGEDIRVARIFGNIVQVIDKKLDDLSK